MKEDIEKQLKEILQKKRTTRCETWYRIRELERLKSWNVGKSPLGQCLYNCSGYNNQCRDYHVENIQIIDEREVEERR